MTSAIDTVPELPAPPSSTTADACLNCGTIPIGPWCHDCGQKSGHVHRSVLHLLAEFLETFTHADSRFWRTMRRLVLNPARLTNDYLAGKRVSEIPPLRLFFVMLLLLFGIGTLTHGQINVDLPPQVHRQLTAELQKITIGPSESATHWLRRHLQKAVDQPDEVLAVARDWAERFAFLMLPIAAVILWVLFLPQRSFTLYDHMIFAIHSLSFMGLVAITSLLLDGLPFDCDNLLLLVLAVHLFAHMRGVYHSPVWSTLLRMLLLGLATTAAFIVLLTGLAVLALQLGARS
jgi:hypothetical protein